MKQYIQGLHFIGKLFVIGWIILLISGVVWRFALNPETVTIENAAIFLAILSLPITLLPKINDFFKKENKDVRPIDRTQE